MVFLFYEKFNDMFESINFDLMYVNKNDIIHTTIAIFFFYILNRKERKNGTMNHIPTTF